MVVRSVTVFAALAFLGAASPALAQNVDPALVLAAKGHPKPGQGFAGRTARLTSIMGADMNSVAPLNVPNHPVRARAARREADASAGLR